jgi:hypothetical protein
MRSKTETSSCLRRYLLEKKRLRVTVRNKQSDSGSEYFNQEGNAPEERARVISQFCQVCAEFNIRHVVRPVGQKVFSAPSADPLTASLREPAGPSSATPSPLRERIDYPCLLFWGGGCRMIP